MPPTHANAVKTRYGIQELREQRDRKWGETLGNGNSKNKVWAKLCLERGCNTSMTTITVVTSVTLGYSSRHAQI